jgi:hypothetical protein
LFFLLLAAVSSVRAPDTEPVVAEFRVFDGTLEVAASTRVRVWPAGRRDVQPLAAEGTTIALPPAVYDIEARRTGANGVVSIAWAERVPVLHYPDERGRHLQVINFQPDHGALQLRAGGSDAFTVAAFRSGNRSVPAANPVAGNGYVLYVLPADRYDVRVQHAEHGGAPDAHWLIGVDVPAGSTRLRLIDSPGV